MADELRIGLSGLLRKAQMEGDAECLKEGVRVLSQALMEMEVFAHQKKARMPETVRGRRGTRRSIRSSPTTWRKQEGSCGRKKERLFTGLILRPGR
jgi:hypothetical protein